MGAIVRRGAHTENSEWPLFVPGPFSSRDRFTFSSAFSASSARAFSILSVFVRGTPPIRLADYGALVGKLIVYAQPGIDLILGGRA
jgi:hypothetical protein